MARRVATVTIDAPGRDQGRTFVITEMPASQAEAWAIRAFLAMARGGVDVPDDIANMGLAGVALMGLDGLRHLRWEDAEPLLDEMWDTIQIVPERSRPNVMRGLVETDVEEIVTRLRLRKEVLALHVDFSSAGSPSTSAPADSATVALTSNTPTSPAPSA